MLKQKLGRNLLSILVVFLGLFFAGLVSFLLALPSKSNEVHSSENNIKRITTVVSVSTSITQPSVSIKTKSVIKTISVITPIPTQNILTPTLVPSSIPVNNSQNASVSPLQVVTPTTSPTSVSQSNKVNVSIIANNNADNFNILVTDGSNQCDVLNQALADGKISNLNMRYDSNFGSYAVYQINGVGQDNSVWWTYTVNGESPNQGCSFIKAKNKDNIEWKYIGS